MSDRCAVMVNHYYFSCVDKEFGPFFIKFCSYFPYNAKLCLNGHEYVAHQISKTRYGYKLLVQISANPQPTLCRVQKRSGENGSRGTSGGRPVTKSATSLPVTAAWVRPSIP